MARRATPLLLIAVLYGTASAQDTGPVVHEGIVVTGVAFEGALFYNAITDTVIQLPFTIDNQSIFLNSEDSRSFGLDTGIRINSATYTNSPYNLFGFLAWTYTDAAFTAGSIEGNRVLDGVTRKALRQP